MPEEDTPPAATPVAPAIPPPAITVPARPTASPSGREILRMGAWSYISNRWRPKNAVGQWVFDIAILVVVFGVLAVLLKLASG